MTQFFRTLLSSLAIGVVALHGQSTAQSAGHDISEYRRANHARISAAGAWCAADVDRNRTVYPALRKLPPIFNGLPSVVVARYAELDRMLQSNEAVGIHESIVNGSIANDSLRRLEGILYSQVDSDPVVFRQYVDEVTMRQGEAYRENLGGIAESLGERLLAADPQKSRAHYSMLHADYVLHVRVKAVDSTIDPESPDYNRYSVVAEVIDTLKGNRFATNGRTNEIRFGYTPLNYMDPSQLTRDRDETVFPYEHTEPLFTTADGRFSMKAGDEAIVFLRHGERLVDQENDYYELNLDPWSSNNALAVVDGEVRDPNNVWSAEGSMSYSQWEAGYSLLRRAIVGE